MRHTQLLEPHQGKVKLQHTFNVVEAWLCAQEEATLSTSAGTRFTPKAAVTERGKHAGEPVIRFFQRAPSLPAFMNAAGDIATTAIGQGWACIVNLWIPRSNYRCSARWFDKGQ
jgi:hypothetical protein